MTADLSTLRSLKERLEKAEGPDRELDESIALAVQWPFPGWDSFSYHAKLHDYGTAWIAHAAWRAERTPAWTRSLEASLSLVREVLPGWWWKVGSCHVSDDACVCPDFNDPVHGERLRSQFFPIELRGPLDGGFDIDQRPPGRPAIAVLRAMIDALIFIAENTPSPSTVSEE